MLEMRPLALAFLSAVALPLGGCCSLAQAWCGPERSAWISVDWGTPELATQTLLEALRRDDPEVVYEALADEMRGSLGVDGLAVELAWSKIKAQYPYLHVAGYADVPAASYGPNRDSAYVTVEVGGLGLRIGLVREAYWELRYRRPGPDLTPQQRDARVGRKLAKLDGAVTIALDEDAEDDRSLVSLTPQSATHFGVDTIPVENVDAVGVFHVWKVRSLTPVDGENAAAAARTPRSR